MHDDRSIGDCGRAANAHNVMRNDKDNMIENNTKFGVLALNLNHMIKGTQLELLPGFQILEKIPIDISDEWKSTVGSFISDKITGANFILMNSLVSENPNILDHENEELRKQMDYFYTGIMISNRFFKHPRGYFIGGSKYDDRIELRDLREWERIQILHGTKMTPLRKRELKEASKIYTSLVKLYSTEGYRSIKRGLMAFVGATTSHKHEERLQGFARSIEGFILPSHSRGKKQFSDRCRIFVGPRNIEDMKTVYLLRSKIIHMGDPKSIFVGYEEKERRLSVLEYAAVVEDLSRSILKHFLLHESIWPHFVDDNSIQAFWQLNESEQRKIWGDELDYNTTKTCFDRTQWDDKMLGL